PRQSGRDRGKRRAEGRGGLPVGARPRGEGGAARARAGARRRRIRGRARDRGDRSPRAGAVPRDGPPERAPLRRPAARLEAGPDLAQDPARPGEGIGVGVRLFNPLGRQLVDFAPREAGHVRLYTCGPTVYNVVHIGNLRTFLWEDVLCRHFRARGWRVTQVMNLTDVDDKTIRGAAQAGLPLRGFTEEEGELFFPGIDRDGVSRA